MDGPRVSAFAVFHATQQQPAQLGPARRTVVARKNKRPVSKLSQKHKLVKKKKLTRPVKDVDVNSIPTPSHPDGLDGEVFTPSRDRSAKKAAKKPKKHNCVGKNERLETPDSRLETVSVSSAKCHIGAPLLTVLEELGKIQNSKDRAASLFKWLISPITPGYFFRDIWEKRPALIRRHNVNYYSGLFSTSEFDQILRENNVQFGVNLDITSYTDGKRETHNPPGRALPLVVWDYYQNGCSLRMLNPQTFSLTVWNVLSTLQELFGSMVGANTYLTPAGTQGFAPHYDDIEAFVVQLEGKKHWRVYCPRQNSERLPQFSSVNFSDDDLGEPVLETVLEAGDLLYFPRGFIHQGDCLPDAHSLHITVSSYQRNCWVDLLGKLLPAALQVAAEEDVEFRKGLPVDYLEYMGVQNADVDDPRRGIFLRKVHSLMKKLTEYAPVDGAVDQKAKEFLHDCLPPALTPAEKAHSVHGAPVRWEDGQVRDDLDLLDKATRISLLRSGIVRLCSEGEVCLLYYTMDNSRIYHKEEPKYMEIAQEHVDAVEYLIHSYPKYVTVGSLPCETVDDKLAVATFLLEKGLLMTKENLDKYCS